MSFNITLMRNANDNNRLRGDFPLGNAPLRNPMLADLFQFDSLDTPQALTLHPTGLAQTGSQIRFSFAIPFPKGALDDVANLVITDDLDNELTTHVESLVPWRDLTDNSSSGVRSARVWMNYTFSDATPISLRFKTGTRTLELGAQTNYKNDWVSTQTQPSNDVDYPTEFTSTTIYEPLVYATQSAEWLCSCNMNPRLAPLTGAFSAGGGSYAATDISGTAWGYDETMLGFANTVVNRVGAHVTTYDSDPFSGKGLTPYETNYESWLYDRTRFLFNCYIRTGDVKWLRHATRSSQFHATLVDANGYFTLRTSKLYYTYSISPFMVLMATGDTDLSEAIDRSVLVGRSGVNFPVYDYAGTSGWTERNFGYMMDQEIGLWEYSGDATAYNNIKTYLDSGIEQQANPWDGSQPEGYIKHTIMDHEGGTGGGTGDENIFSPWMTNIMFGPYFRAYVMSGDDKYLQFIANYGQAYATAMYQGTYDSQTRTVPWYIAGELNFTDAGIYGDISHSIDVLGAVGLILWAKTQLAQVSYVTELEQIVSELKDSAKIEQAGWYRNSQETIDAGYPIWRCAPTRRQFWQHNFHAAYKWLETTREAV